jgi:hypothetical protein
VPAGFAMHFLEKSLFTRVNADSREIAGLFGAGDPVCPLWFVRPFG